MTPKSLKIEFTAMNIVHQIGDVLYEALPRDIAHEHFVTARQKTNDLAIDFAKKLISERLTQAAKEATAKERESWMNQPANEHDQRIRVAATKEGYDRGVAEWYKDEEFDRGRETALREVEEIIEGMNKCWCGGGKHFMKSRCVFHTSECALNNQGYYDALDALLATLKSSKGKLEQ